MEMDFVVIPDELEDCDMKAAGQRDAILLDANGVVFNVLTSIRKKKTSLILTFMFHIKPLSTVKTPLHLNVTSGLCGFVIYYHFLILT